MPLARPVVENAELGTLTELMERAIFPVFFSVTDCEVELFTARVPKFREAGDAVSAGVAFSPEPESGTLTGAFKSELEITSEPEAPEALEGAKTTLTLTCAPTGSITGTFAGESVNAEPETRSCPRPMGSALELVILMVCEFFWPTTTDLKSMIEGITEIFAPSAAEDLSAETEAQPEIAAEMTTAATRI